MLMTWSDSQEQPSPTEEEAATPTSQSEAAQNTPPPPPRMAPMGRGLTKVLLASQTTPQPAVSQTPHPPVSQVQFLCHCCAYVVQDSVGVN